MKNSNYIEYENLKRTNMSFEKEFKDSFFKFLDSGYYVLGDQVKRFEDNFAKYNNSKFCVGVNSGLDALILAIDVLGLEKNSEIIVPSNTYIATILAIVRLGFKAVLVEPDIKTYNIDSQKIEEKINKNTKVIIAVHLYGKSANMDDIAYLAKKYNLFIIEDCAQAHGASFKAKKVGSFGIGAFSFYPTKNLGALGDGGAIVLDDEDLYLKLKALRNYGSSKKYYNDYIAYNSRLDELQAGFLDIKLKKLNDINERKRKIAEIYLRNIDDRFIKPLVDKDYYDVFHIFAIRTKKRDKLKKYLLDNGIQTEIHYPLAPHKQMAMKGIINENFPISQEIHDTILSLPIAYFLSDDEAYRVCETINGFKF